MMKQKNIEFSLRPATIDDIEFIFQLRVKTMKPLFINTLGWNDAEERENSAVELNHAKIVMVDQKKIGVIKVVPGVEELHLNLQILPEFQGKGVGGELVQETILHSKEMQKPISLYQAN